MKTFIIFLTVFITHFSLAQYDDYYEQPKTDTTKNDTTFSYDEDAKSKYENVVKGTGFFINPFNGYLYAELSPFVGYQIKPWAQLCAGVQGIVAAGLSSNSSSYLYYGPYAFARAYIGEEFFVQAEFDLLNAPDFTAAKKRLWIQSPIIGGGYFYDGGFWIFFGFALDQNFSEYVPNERLIYRFGITF